MPHYCQPGPARGRSAARRQYQRERLRAHRARCARSAPRRPDCIPCGMGNCLEPAACRDERGRRLATISSASRHTASSSLTSTAAPAARVGLGGRVWAALRSCSCRLSALRSPPSGAPGGIGSKRHARAASVASRRAAVRFRRYGSSCNLVATPAASPAPIRRGTPDRRSGRTRAGPAACRSPARARTAGRRGGAPAGPARAAAGRHRHRCQTHRRAGTRTPRTSRRRGARAAAGARPAPPPLVMSGRRIACS
jgi:hypothetical protein